MFCRNCQTIIPDDSLFCENCGAPTGLDPESIDDSNLVPEEAVEYEISRDEGPAVTTSVPVDPVWWEPPEDEGPIDVDAAPVPEEEPEEETADAWDTADLRWQHPDAAEEPPAEETPEEEEPDGGEPDDIWASDDWVADDWTADAWGAKSAEEPAEEEPAGVRPPEAGPAELPADDEEQITEETPGRSRTGGIRGFFEKILGDSDDAKAGGSRMTEPDEYEPAGDEAAEYEDYGEASPEDRSAARPAAGFGKEAVTEPAEEIWNEPAAETWGEPAAGPVAGFGKEAVTEPAEEIWNEPAAEAWGEPAEGPTAGFGKEAVTEPAEEIWNEPAAETWGEPADGPAAGFEKEAVTEPAEEIWNEPTTEAWNEPADGPAAGFGKEAVTESAEEIWNEPAAETWNEPTVEIWDEPTTEVREGPGSESLEGSTGESREEEESHINAEELKKMAAAAAEAARPYAGKAKEWLGNLGKNVRTGTGWAADAAKEQFHQRREEFQEKKEQRDQQREKEKKEKEQERKRREREKEEELKRRQEEDSRIEENVIQQPGFWYGDNMPKPKVVIAPAVRAGSERGAAPEDSGMPAGGRSPEEMTEGPEDAGMSAGGRSPEEITGGHKGAGSPADDSAPKDREEIGSGEAAADQSHRPDEAKETETADSEEITGSEETSGPDDMTTPGAPAESVDTTESGDTTESDDTTESSDTTESGDTAGPDDTTESGDTAESSDITESGDTAESGKTTESSDTTEPEEARAAAWHPAASSSLTEEYIEDKLADTARYDWSLGDLDAVAAGYVDPGLGPQKKEDGDDPEESGQPLHDEEQDDPDFYRIRDFGPGKVRKRRNFNKNRWVMVAIIVAVILAIVGVAALMVHQAHVRQMEEEAYQAELQQVHKIVEKGKYKKAEKRYLKLIDEHPDDTAPYLGLAKMYIEQQRYVDAKALIKRAVKATGDKEAFKPLKKEIKILTSTEWKEAYITVLEENESDIRRYEEDVTASTAVCDVNGDRRPELFFFTKEYYGYGKLHIYTIVDKTAKEVDYECANRGTQYQDAFYDVSSSDSSYAIFNEKEEGRFAIYANVGREGDSWDTTNEFELNLKGGCKQVLLLESSIDPTYTEGEKDDSEYLMGDEDITYDKYITEFRRILDGVQQVILYNGSGGDQAVWDKITQDNVMCMPYDTMMVDLHAK